jgi:F0F1-type ATP synthase assembly protein I
MSSKNDKKSAADIGEVQVSRRLVSAAIEATIRVFVAIFGLFLLGLLVDFLRGQMAFFAIIGTFLGVILAIFLVIQQIKRMNSADAKITFLDRLFNDEFRGASAKISRKNPEPREPISRKPASKKSVKTSRKPANKLSRKPEVKR